MKILAIRGKNLASLNGEFEIDFTTDPLKSSGIFAITGPTGSGKSTLLDALCLALYDSTPRLNKARENNVSLLDVNDKKINQNDTRSILRRGTADGYAEVDFLSVTGDVYRSTWMVRRGRNSVTGSLQPVDMRLVNQSTGEEEKGTKTELLEKISKYVGLTFEQFNRSVLLAQGDFAMFLKARQNEKAEILEKLTGTEIYSRVSSTIYNKAKEIISEQKQLKDRIDDITLLTDDELMSLDEEKNEIKKRMDSSLNEQERINNSLKWITDEALLSGSVKEAEETLQKSIKAIDEASFRFERLEAVDQVQPIRDMFIHFLNAKRELQKNKTSLENTKNEYTKDLALLDKSSKEVDIIKKEIDDFDKKSSEYEPLINRARELDVVIKENLKQRHELNEETKKLSLRKDTIEKNISKCKKDAQESHERLDKIKVWFDNCEKFQPLVSAIALVKSLLDNIYNAQKQLNDNNAQLKSLASRKKEIDAALTEKNEEQERLNKLLPSEVVMMRSELVDGKPCPVCGSIHHPYLINVEQEQSIKDDELNRSKENVKKDIERLTKDSDENNRQTTRITALIENDNRLMIQSKDSLSNYVCAIPNWEELLERGELKDKVEIFEKQWNDKIAEQTTLNDAISKFDTRKEGLDGEYESISQLLTEKSEILSSSVAEGEKLSSERQKLFDGRETDEVVKERKIEKKVLDDKLAKLNESKHSFEMIAQSNKTKITQLEEAVDNIMAQIADDDSGIDRWIVDNDSSMSREKIEELITLDVNNIARERKALTLLLDNRKNSESVFKERDLKLKNHENDNNRPSDDESRESLTQALLQLRQTSSKDAERNATITVLVDRNKNEGEKKNKLLKQLEEKKDVYDNWSALNSLFGSSDGSKFKEIAQGYTLDVLLFYANKHLEDLAPRYELQRIPDSLALQIADLDMVGEVRSVHSLSGGESFLVSLALALGLSSLSSNRMNVESLFIDEGFGSLDIDTLRIAMDALERLQMQGRKIGVISHVEEMTERISVQVQVVKEGNGVSKVVVRS